jgi:hypothetical protein
VAAVVDLVIVLFGVWLKKAFLSFWLKLTPSLLDVDSKILAQNKLLLPFVRTKGNQKPPAEKKRAKRHYGPLKETKAPARSLQFYKFLGGVVSFLTLPFVAFLTPFFSLGRILGVRSNVLCL